MASKQPNKKTVETITHNEASRKNIPTAEYRSVMDEQDRNPIRVAYARRNRDLDPQLIWRGKDQQDWSDLVVHAPPLYIQEKVHPKVIIDDLVASEQWLVVSGKRSANHQPLSTNHSDQTQLDLFGDFNGLPEGADKTDFYHYEGNWQNRMILGDSLQVMASLAEREGLRGKVQCIYLDPPYGIKFNSNFQWSTTSRDVKDGKAEHITREPEQVKAFRDTWRDGIHSYLTYLRDRLTVARDLLTESGSIFVQIGDENVHRVRAVMDEVFGDENCVNLITFQKTSSSTSDFLGGVADYLLWYAKSKTALKFRQALYEKKLGGDAFKAYNKVLSVDGTMAPLDASGDRNGAIVRIDNITSQSVGRDKGEGAASWFPVDVDGRDIRPSLKVRWKTNEQGMARLKAAGRVHASANSLGYIRKLDDYAAAEYHHIWSDTVISGSSLDKQYVVETLPLVIQRCLLMATDPGDLVLDPTCGSGTTAYVAEQWGRRWITIDTSRVALALARARIMGARYPYYLLADSPEGQLKEAEVTRSVPSSAPTYGKITHGFVFQRVPHITLKSIANNSEIDVIWDKFEAGLAPLREKLTAALPDGWLVAYRSQQNYTAEVPDAIQEWEIPRERPSDWPLATEPLITAFWRKRIERQKAIDASIAAKADFEYLYDRPYEDKGIVRVAGPFTVESLSPHRVLGVDENDELIDSVADGSAGYNDESSFVRMILENLKTAGIQQAHKEDRIAFTSLTPWPGDLVCAVGTVASDQWLVNRDKNRERSEHNQLITSHYPLTTSEGSEHNAQATNHQPLTTNEHRAAIFIGPEFGTVSRPDLVAAAREAGDADFDVMIACAFNYDAHASEFDKLGRIPVLKARMNADLHMADDLKNTGKGNLFVIFGEPDIDIIDAEGGQIQVKVNGVDVFHPQNGEVRSDGPEGIACWFIDTDYNEESFFVRQAYFLGANDPYKALKTTLKAEINEDAWATLHGDTSRPFAKPTSGRIAVKVINHLGDEVMKVFRV